MGKPEGLGLIIVFDHACFLSLKVDSRRAVVFYFVFEIRCNFCAMGFGGVFAIQYRVVVGHSWCMIGERALL